MKTFRLILPTLTITLGLCAVQSLNARQSLPSADSADSQDIGDRIARLDDRQFPVREKALAELSKVGVEALDELATAYLDGSTEQRWRILKILEQVSIDTEEDGFYQIAAVLRVLGGYQYGPTQIAGLHRQWQNGKSERAAQRLRNAGAKVEIDNGINSFGSALRDPFFLMGNNQVIVRQDVIVFGGGMMPVDASAPPPTGMLDPKIETEPVSIPATKNEKLELLDEIIQSDIDSNRQIAIAPLRVDPPENESPTEGAANVFQYNKNAVDMNLSPFGGTYDYSSGDYRAPVNAVFGPGWKGTPEQLSEASAVSGLMSIEFNSRPTVTAKELSTLARVPDLKSLSIINSAIDSESVDLLAEFPKLNTLVLDLGRVDEGWLEAVTSLPELMHVRLIAPVEGSIDLTEIGRLQSLRHLSLQGMEIDAETFGILEKVPFLSTLVLQNCRFDLSECRAFKSARPQLQVTATGNSFLGVRGPTMVTEVPGFTCRISEVVPGSAAEIAGVLPNDLIRKMEGLEINSFSDLILVVSQKQPGETVNMEVYRDGKILNLTAELGDKANAPAQ